jgi:hypothetical protein
MGRNILEGTQGVNWEDEHKLFFQNNPYLIHINKEIPASM